MAYFNHAFTKMFLGTGPTRTPALPGVTDPATDNGMLITTGTPTVVLANLPAASGPHTGYFGFFDPKTYLLIDPNSTTYNCCPLLLASSSVLQNDKIGPFHGGYQETNKSKLINPKYVQNAYRVDACSPKQAVVSIGNTPTTGTGITAFGGLVAGAGYPINSTLVVGVTGGTGLGAKFTITTNGTGNVTTAVLYNAGTGYTVADVLTLVGGTATVTVSAVSTGPAVFPDNFQGGTTDAQCCFQFFCGETYYLRIDVKGSPALRALNHNAYQTLDAYTGCCAGPTPTLVDSTLVMIEWAKQILINNYLKPFVLPVVFDETGVAWYAPGTTVDPITLLPVLPTQWWTAYVSPGHIAGQCAGLRLFGAYVSTLFGDCTFQITDYFEREPVKILASMVDYTGDPCVFEGICVYNDCLALQGMGFGDTVVKNLILAESYLQNFFANNDLRIREITQGYDMTNAINRNALYTRYFILHSVPRWNNPTGVFDADRYMLEIITTAPIATLDTFLPTWLNTCADCVPFETQTCVPCVPVNN